MPSANVEIINPTLIASLFTRTFVDRVIQQEYQSYLSYVLRETNLKSIINDESTLSSTLSCAYNFLLKHYRCEYVFKNAILNDILLKNHSLHDSVYLTEFRAHNTKADIVVLNGTSSVYEIKSDIDNLDRLLNQVEVYQKIFDKVNVVSNVSNLDKLKRILPNKVGISILCNKSTIESVRIAKSNLRQLDKSYMFDCLRKKEYLAAINQITSLPISIPNTQIHDYCKAVFVNIPTQKAHHLFLSALKTRNLEKSQISLLKTNKTCVKALLIDKKYTYKDCEMIKLALSQKLILNTKKNVFTLSKS